MESMSEKIPFRIVNSDMHIEITWKMTHGKFYLWKTVDKCTSFYLA